MFSETFVVGVTVSAICVAIMGWLAIHLLSTASQKSRRIITPPRITEAKARTMMALMGGDPNAATTIEPRDGWGMRNNERILYCPKSGVAVVYSREE